MPRRRKPAPATRQGPRIRPELRPSAPRYAATGAHDEPVLVEEPDDLDELEELDDAEFDRRLTGEPDRPASAQGGTAVGILLGLGVLLGAIAAYVAGLPILPALVIGGVLGAIAGIVIDRRRAADAQEPPR
ncbi:MAG TPA: hypothetical protein VGT61_13455 [Thermomicrobiales bacterium]|jgi:hypothetical protein|nr:hypothetical protein [Thermomicrobiales bacterium]